MKNIVLITYILFNCALLYGADSNNVSLYNVTGQGRDRDEAIKNGLYLAVSQARGVKVGSGSYEYGFLGAAADINSNKSGGKRVEFDAVSVETAGTTSTTEVAGLVKSYEILEENKLDDGNYKIKMNVLVYKLTSPASKRIKLAVMPVKPLYPIYSFGDLPVQGEKLSMLLSHKIATALTETNKFDVLDRENIIEFAKEGILLTVFDAPLEQQAKLIETLGADYMFIGTISDAGIRIVDKPMPAAGITERDYKARFVLNYRIISAATKQVIFAAVCEKYYEKEDLRGFSSEWNPANWDPAEIRDGIISQVARDVVQTILDRLYPIKIASIENNQIIINQGGNKLSEGMLLDVFTQGTELFDEDTKESLGKLENQAATIRITKVTPKVSYCEIENGDISKLSTGLICRIKNIKKSYEQGMKSDVIRDKDGGVTLPFDKK